MWIAEGRIAAIASGLSAGANETVIDAAGAWLLPGLPTKGDMATESAAALDGVRERGYIREGDYANLVLMTLYISVAGRHWKVTSCPAIRTSWVNGAMVWTQAGYFMV